MGSSTPEPARRRRAAGALALGLLGWAAAGLAACPTPRLAPVAPQVFAVVAAPALAPAPANCGRVANTGVVVGRDGVVVIDPGPSYAEGRRLGREIARRIGLPVRAVVLSHAHAENVLATAVLAGRDGIVIASSGAAALMDERCPACLRRLRQALGAAAMARTRIALPNRRVETAVTEMLAGRSLRLMPFDHGHSRGDLAVLDIDSGVLFAGGLVYAGQVPETREASFAGWRAALDELARGGARRVVPGHGLPGGPELLQEMDDYLGALAAGAAAEVAAGRDLPAALERLALPAHAAHFGYAERHGFNVQRAYAEAEAAYFNGRP